MFQTLMNAVKKLPPAIQVLLCIIIGVGVYGVSQIGKYQGKDDEAYKDLKATNVRLVRELKEHDSASANTKRYQDSINFALSKENRQLAEEKYIIVKAQAEEDKRTIRRQDSVLKILQKIR